MKAFMAFTTVLFAQAALSSSNYPPLSLDFTFRQVEEGKSSKMVYPTQFVCEKSGCLWVNVELNRCSDTNSFYPKIETYSSQEGNLSVDSLGNDTVKVTLNNQIAFVLKFSCTIVKQLGNRKLCNNVLDLKGSVTKHSPILEKIITTNYEQVRGEIDLDCKKISLPPI